MRHCGKGNPLRVFQELQPNSLYRAVRFANFKGFWVFLFRQSFDWERGYANLNTMCSPNFVHLKNTKSKWADTTTGNN